ncbi:uncharacterized protein LOC143909897 [Arctopsyche grandis]|uniref:uncharacterized protein LOC143909897 n=1 Tax=Arctopsyche grandis TaxID=121162 RepID=UPI00406D88FA
MDAEENPHCFVCNSRVGVSVRNAVEIFHDQNKLPTSNKTIALCIGDIIGKKLDKESVHSLIACKKCYKLLREYDELEFRVNEIKAEVLNHFRNTVEKNNLDRESYTNLEMDSHVNAKVVNNESIKIKEEFISTDDSNSTEWIKSSKFSEIKKIAPMPANLVIVGHKGKKITIQKPAIKIPINASKLPNSIDTTEEEKHQVDPVELQMQQLHQAEGDSDKNSECDNSLDNTNQIKISNQQDVEEIKTKIEECEKSGVTEYLSEYDGIIVKTEETSTEEQQNDDKYVISELEIVDNSSSDMLLEDGTILMEQTEDGNIIKVVHHAGKNIIQDDQGNIYRTDEDGNIEVILPDQDNDDDDIVHYETINLKDGGSIIKFSPGVFNREMFKNKKINGILGLEDEDDKDDSADNLEMDTDPSNPTAMKAAENLYSCLMCDSTVGDKSKEENIKKEDNPSEMDEENSIRLCDANMIREHMKTVHNTKIYICSPCGDVHTTKDSILEHLSQHVSKKGEYQCDICSKVYESQTLLRKHQRFLHWRSKNYHCNICNKKFGSKNLLEEHSNIHKGLKPYNCDMCGKNFSSKYTHQSHMKTHMDRPRPYTCSQCGKSFLTLQNLTQHEKTHLGIKDYVCKICGKAFGTQHNLEVHGVVHTGFKPYKCKTCGKGFARRAEIRDHERTHTGERPYVCDICGASFSQRSNLQSHKRATHFDDKRYKCHLCEKCFKRRRLLEYHIKATHTGERPFRCQVCDATFVYPEHFKKHQRIHSGEKPYKCEVCQKAFNSRDNRNAHRFVHSDKKPYECLDCGAGFMRKPMLYAHMHTQGHLSDTIVVNQPRLGGDTETSSFDGRNTFVIENGQEEISTKVKKEDSSNDFKQNIPILVNAADESHDGTAIITKTEVEIMPDEETYLESTEGVIDEDMLDPQRIEIIDGDNTHEVSEVLVGEDGTLRLVQIQLSDGENAWVALND